MSGITIALAEILRCYSFSYTQLRRDVVPYQVHGALRAPPDEADLGPARFWAGVHRRERCSPETVRVRAARRLVQAVRSVANWPRRAALPRSRSRQPQTPAKAALTARGGRGSPPAGQSGTASPVPGFAFLLNRFTLGKHAQI